MPYYPKSQIQTDLYTKGDEYILSTTKQNYTGPYYKIFTGQKYTGKNPQDGPNILLLPNPAERVEGSTDPNQIEYVFPNVNIIENDFSSNSYSYNTIHPEITPRSIPQFNVTLPTDKDKQLGAFTRYFCKKNNELKYLEIDKDTYNLLQTKNKQIAFDLYTGYSILWYIKGEKEKIYKANKSIVNSTEQKQKWYGFSKYLKEDYLKYYFES